MVRAHAGSRGPGSLNGPPSRGCTVPGIFGCEGVLGVVLVRAYADSRKPGSPNGPPSGGFTFRGIFGCEGVSGVVVVRAYAGCREPGSPNGPPSPRLAPGGFYGKGDWLRAKRGACTLFQLEDAWNTGSRGVAGANRAGVAGERRQDAESEPASSARRAWMPEASVRRDGTGRPEPAAGESPPQA